ncbi:MAG: hypothetical protein DMG89_20345 [Acidobacteria bacterium]|nr:MAG: hypothetical protein DMG89_20345 [Acidobacteriota bacterium]
MQPPSTLAERLPLSVRRYRSLGLPGLRDRSSRPLRSPRRTSSELIAQVIGLRRQLRPACHIAQATGLSPGGAGWPTFRVLVCLRHHK